MSEITNSLIMKKRLEMGLPATPMASTS